VDKSESQREAKLKETLSNLKRVFPGKLLELFIQGEADEQVFMVELSIFVNRQQGSTMWQS